MNLRRKILNHYKRWDIQVDQSQEFERFKNRILTVVDRTVGVYLLENPSISEKFSFNLGHKQRTVSAIGWPVITRALRASHLLSEKKFTEHPVYIELATTANQGEMVLSLQMLFWVLADAGCTSIGALAEAVRTAADVTPFIEIRVAVRGNAVTLYPRGAPILDQGAVNEVLEGLHNHRRVAEAFEQALKLYQQKDPSNYRLVADNLRVALERLLKRVLPNRKSLENQGEALARWLEKKGLQTQLRNMFKGIVERISAYNNDWVKHDDATRPGHQPSETEIECMIYLTGTFMRLLLEMESKK